MRRAGRPAAVAAGIAVSAALLALAAGGAVAEEITVRMEGVQYQPRQIQAQVGDTLRFVNEDGVTHDVLVPTPGFGVDLGKSEPGSEKTLPLAMAGTFEVECVFHDHMLTTVTVTR